MPKEQKTEKIIDNWKKPNWVTSLLKPRADLCPVCQGEGKLVKRGYSTTDVASLLKPRADLCPVCQGEGKLVKRGYSTTDVASLYKTCHGCDGKGWVIVKDYAKRTNKQTK